MNCRIAGVQHWWMNHKAASNPGHPERICWGCSQFCRDTDLRCGNGSERAQHPFEVFGEDWEAWGLDVAPPAAAQAEAATETVPC
jgi:hypothetical protein